MANITITKTGGLIDVDFGDYGDGNRAGIKARFRSDNIEDVMMYNDYVLLLMSSGVFWYLCYTETKTYYIVDSIDTQSISSNSDLYDKIKVLM